MGERRGTRQAEQQYPRPDRAGRRGERGDEPLPGRLSRFLPDRRGQSTAVGMALVLAIAAISTGLVVTLGAEALAETERTTDLVRGEHALTRLDSRASMVALGQTTAQEVRLGTGDRGQYRASSDDGWIRVVHRNHTGSDDEVLYNASLGSVRYVSGDTTVAYQGGGVWRTGPEGTTMVSPPEFHYRGSTLTLPVVRVVTDDAARGASTATISQPGPVEHVFPDESTAYEGTTVPYQNPVDDGSVVVTVHSQFYRGWAEHFRRQTDGTVTVDHENRTASVVLDPVGTGGAFSLADLLDGDGVRVRGQSPGHSVTDFQVDFREDHGTVSNFYFSFHAEEGPHRLELLVHVDEGTTCNDDGVQGDEVLEVYYLYRNTETGVQHEWSNTSVPADAGPFRVECDGKTATVHLDFTGETALHYGEVSLDGEGSYYDWSGSPSAEANVDHNGTDGEEPTYYPDQSPSAESASILTRHYLALLGEDFQLRGDMGTGNRGGPQIDVGASEGRFDYEMQDQASSVIYLHITENKIAVEFR